MESKGQSSCYKINTLFWNIFGIWPGRNPSKYYKYYSFAYIFFTLVIYLILLTVSLFFTPIEIETLTGEGIYYFTEIAVAVKVAMIIRMREKIIEVFELLDCEQFQGKDQFGEYIIAKNISNYKVFWKTIAILSHLAYVLQILAPVLIYLIWKTKVDLPVCQYFFLSEEIRQNFFWLFRCTNALAYTVI
ncbi:unnamed protein product [Diatraea saccharalis]|uniref:Uncharacterized protein n=1 Tax=Diatraea saccharalis TaxID=40085 RepID=A0A9N9WKE2_9NEOP|nr:unnamed protein product [Diatraea saccharalis]